MSVAALGLAVAMSGIAVAGAGAANAGLPKGEWRNYSAHTTYSGCKSTGVRRVRISRSLAAWQCRSIKLGNKRYMLYMYYVYPRARRGN